MCIFSVEQVLNVGSECMCPLSLNRETRDNVTSCKVDYLTAGMRRDKPAGFINLPTSSTHQHKQYIKTKAFISFKKQQKQNLIIVLDKD